MSEMTFTIMGPVPPNTPVTGFDSMCAAMPKAMYRNGAVVTRKLHVLLRTLSNVGAANVGEPLHHAQWVITRDPDKVRKGIIHPRHPDCTSCLSALDQALAHLATDDTNEVLLGTLFWADNSAERPSDSK